MSTRVDHIIAEITELSADEREELLRRLPADLHSTTPKTRTAEAVERAIAHREQIRARLLAEGKPLFSVVDDIDAMRDERLAELMAALPSAQSRDRDEDESAAGPTAP